MVPTTTKRRAALCVATLVVLLCTSYLLVNCAATPTITLNPLELQARCDQDHADLLRYRNQFRAVVDYMVATPEVFPTARPENATLLNREAREVALSTWRSTLDAHMALEHIRLFHAGFFRLNHKPQKTLSFLAHYGAFLAQYRFALEFIAHIENDANLAVLLDEPSPEHGIGAGTYSRYRFRFLNVLRATEFAALGVVAELEPAVGAPTLMAAVAQDRDRLCELGKGKGEKLTIKNAWTIAKSGAKTLWLPLQTGVSEWMGDTKVWRQSTSLVTPEQITSLQEQLLPGDIILSRREWYLSNIGLPGFWPHAALYIGTPSERARAFAKDASVQAWLAQQRAADGSLEKLLQEGSAKAYRQSLVPHSDGAVRVIEAISEGVSLTTLAHAAGADAVCVLRPRLPAHEKVEAIVRAFGYVGRPYDFDFDFRTDATLVCTELVYKAYEPTATMTGIRFPLTSILGRQVTPANLIVQDFDTHFGTAKQQFDLVVFLDGVEKQARAVEAPLKAFRASWQRPKWHIFVQDDPLSP